MKTILTALFAIISLEISAAPPPPFFRNNYDTQACTYVFIDCRGLITANNNTSIVVNSQWNTIDNAIVAGSILGGLGNQLAGGVLPAADFSLISGGEGSDIQYASDHSIIGCGYLNSIKEISPFSSIVGGTLNFIGPSSPYGFIGGGANNVINLGSYCVIGGGRNHLIDVNDPNTGYATISGGYQNRSFTNYSTVAGGIENFVYGLAGTISGGGHNTIQTNSDHGFIGGGSLNQITNSCSYGVIAGGTTNMITNGFAGVISGGQFNRIDSIGGYCVIGGGYSNIIHYLDSFTAKADGSTISGGKDNYITASFASIGGGVQNTIAHDVDDYGTIGGGFKNWVGQDFSTIAGGRENTNSTGNYSFIMGGYSNRTEGAVTVAGGRSACAMADGTWMFKDNSSGARSNTTANSFETYFTGGDNKLGVLNVTMTGTNRSLKGTRSDGVLVSLIGLLSDTNRIQSSGANFGVIFTAADGTLLTRMDNSGNWGFGTNVPQAKIHILGTGTNVAVLRFANCDTNKPATPDAKVRYLAVILDDGIKYFIPLEK